MNEQPTFRKKVAFQTQRRGQTVITTVDTQSSTLSSGRIPRITKLLALAHRFDTLIREGVVRDYAELARLGHVTRARVTQIMNLLNLALDIQFTILSWSDVGEPPAVIPERQLRVIVMHADWREQRALWALIATV